MVFDVSPHRLRQVAHGNGVGSITIRMGASVAAVVSLSDFTPALETFTERDVSLSRLVTSSRDGVTAGSSLGQKNSTAESKMPTCVSARRCVYNDKTEPATIRMNRQAVLKQ